MAEISNPAGQLVRFHLGGCEGSAGLTLELLGREVEPEIEGPVVAHGDSCDHTAKISAKKRCTKTLARWLEKERQGDKLARSTE